MAVHSHHLIRRRVRPPLPAVCAAALLLAVGCSSGSGSDDARSTPSASPADTAVLPAACSAWVSDTKTEEPIASYGSTLSAVWSKIDGYLEFGARWENNTDFVAVNVTAELQIFFNEEDITSQLPHQDRLARYRPHTIDVMLPTELAKRQGESYRTGTVTLEMPPSPQWYESRRDRTDLETVVKVERWCVPKQT